jgi:hypothetical protein
MQREHSELDNHSEETLNQFKRLDTQILALTQTMIRSELVLVDQHLGTTIVETMSPPNQLARHGYTSKSEI